MKFYYEFGDMIPNGPKDYCNFSFLDTAYGFKNRIYELNTKDEIIWNFTPKNMPFSGRFIDDNIDYFSKVFEQVADKVNIKIVFSNFHEGFRMNDFYEKIVPFKRTYNLRKSQVIIITMNGFAGQYSEDITIMYKPYLLWDLSKNYKTILNQEHQVNNSVVSLATTESYLTTLKEKYFLSYNKNTTRFYRIRFFLWLLKTGLIDETLYSLLIKRNIDTFEFSSYNSKPEFDETNDLTLYINKFNNLEYTLLDWDYNANDIENNKFSSTKYTTKEHYTKTLFSIVTEMSFNHSSNNITEKTFKPIGNCHPFIVIGDHNLHNTLTHYGFELYDDLIDYTFDKVWENELRFNLVLKEIKKIYELGEEKLIAWYKKNIDKIEKNKKIFLEFGKRDLIRETINDLKMKKVLITGACGLVGTHLVRKCIDEGYYVIGCDIIEPMDVLDTFYYKHYKMDLTNDNDLKNLFLYEKPDAVFNCFGIKGSPIKAKERPVDFLYPSFKINTEIINQCAKNKIWLVFVSSVGVYSPAEKFVEGDVWKTLPGEADWYPSWSKRMGEILLQAYQVQEQYNSWAIIRPANIFGEFDDFSGRGTVISTTIKKIHDSTGEIECWGDGSPIRDFVYAGDVADAILKLYKEEKNEIVNFGSGVEVSIKDLVDMLIKISEKDINVTWDTSKPNGDLRRLMDTTKQKELNLLPKLGLEEALKITYIHYIKKQYK
jgi:GDP-L-fucose synthase